MKKENLKTMNDMIKIYERSVKIQKPCFWSLSWSSLFAINAGVFSFPDDHWYLVHKVWPPNYDCTWHLVHNLIATDILLTNDDPIIVLQYWYLVSDISCLSTWRFYLQYVLVIVVGGFWQFVVGNSWLSSFVGNCWLILVGNCWLLLVVVDCCWTVVELEDVVAP